jgi:hypothetical protein
MNERINKRKEREREPAGVSGKTGGKVPTPVLLNFSNKRGEGILPYPFPSFLWEVP